jgi:hypothetical protein
MARTGRGCSVCRKTVQVDDSKQYVLLTEVVLLRDETPPGEPMRKAAGGTVYVHPECAWRHPYAISESVEAARARYADSHRSADHAGLAKALELPGWKEWAGLVLDEKVAITYDRWFTRWDADRQLAAKLKELREQQERRK